jgi:hypothetical protein
MSNENWYSYTRLKRGQSTWGSVGGVILQLRCLPTSRPNVDGSRSRPQAHEKVTTLAETKASMAEIK